MWGGPYGWGPAVWSVNQNSEGSGRLLDRATVTDAHAVIVSDVYEAVRQMDYNLVCDDNQRRWIITHILQPRLIWGTWGGQGTALALSSVAGGTLGMHVRQFDYANIYKAHLFIQATLVELRYRQCLLMEVTFATLFDSVSYWLLGWPFGGVRSRNL